MSDAEEELYMAAITIPTVLSGFRLLSNRRPRGLYRSIHDSLLYPLNLADMCFKLLHIWIDRDRGRRPA